MTDICSKLAYEEALENGFIGNKQAQVLKIFVDNFPREYTATQIVKILGRGVSETVRNRMTELYDKGYLEKSSFGLCPDADARGKKRLVNFFRYTGRKNPKIKSIVQAVCPHCKGTGNVEKKVFIEPADDVPYQVGSDNQAKLF